MKAPARKTDDSAVDLMESKTHSENIRDIHEAFRRGEINEKEAVERLERLRSKRHGFIERYLSRLG